MASRLQDVIQRGLASARPAANLVAPGTLYFSTDTGVTERSSGAAWESYSSLSGTERLFAALPTSPPMGALINISNSTVDTPGATVTGGGSFHVLARWNGTNWRVIG